MDLTNASLSALFSNFSFLFQQGFVKPEPIYTKIAQVVPSNTSQNVYPFLASMPGMREWVGPRIIHHLTSFVQTVPNKKFELTLSMGRELIEDDQYGIYRPWAEQAGWSAAMWPDVLLADMVQSNPVGFDGVALFHDAHPDLGTSGTGTQDNNFALPLTPTNFAAVRAAMQGFKGDNNFAIGVNPSLLLVPPQLEYMARTIVNASIIAPPMIGAMTGLVGSTTNVLAGLADVVVVPRFANQPTTWYVLDVSRPIKPFIFQQRLAPEFVFKNRPDDDNVFLEDEVLFGVRARGAATIGLWFLAARSVG